MKIIVFAEHTHNFSARLVQLGMWLWQVVRFRKPVKVYNHWGFRVIGNAAYNYEATAHGVKVTTRPLAPEWRAWQVELTDNAIEYLTLQEDKKYEYANFLFHALRILFPAWLGSRNDDKHSCVELVTRTLRKSGYDVKIWSNPVELKEWMETMNTAQ